MNYNLTAKEDRKRFIRRANVLLKNQRTNVSLIDESNRTTNQNSYLHVLCRIMAVKTGVTESYAKQVYFKTLANPELFVTSTKDPVTDKMLTVLKSSSELSISNMRKAITNFRNWAAENGYYLPDANIADDGSVQFKTTQDKASFDQAIIETSKEEIYL